MSFLLIKIYSTLRKSLITFFFNIHNICKIEVFLEGEKEFVFLRMVRRDGVDGVSRKISDQVSFKHFDVFPKQSLNKKWSSSRLIQNFCRNQSISNKRLLLPRSIRSLVCEDAFGIFNFEEQHMMKKVERPLSILLIIQKKSKNFPSHDNFFWKNWHLINVPPPNKLCRLFFIERKRDC